MHRRLIADSFSVCGRSWLRSPDSCLTVHAMRSRRTILSLTGAAWLLFAAGANAAGETARSSARVREVPAIHQVNAQLSATRKSRQMAQFARGNRNLSAQAATPQQEPEDIVKKKTSPPRHSSNIANSGRRERVRLSLTIHQSGWRSQRYARGNPADAIDALSGTGGHDAPGGLPPEPETPPTGL